MNKTFKTLWNDVRRCYIVANEAQKTHGKPSKAAVVAVAVAAAMGATVASAAYVEPGFVAQNKAQFEQAKQSWETKEYQKDWGLTAMKASTAYALGYHGQGVAVGVMDSGALLYKHPELNGDRFHASVAQGEYSSTGNRYPQGALPQFDGTYEKGESFDITGEWVLNTNDSHGTHVTGTVGANRDGSEFHGVSWGSDVYVGNTGGTDDSNYGPFLDYGYFRTAWGNLAQDLIKENGEARGGVINNSFGTNTRVVNNGTYGNDGYSIGTMLPVNTVQESEYEYFLFQKQYGDNPSFVDAAWEAVKGTNVVQVMTTGNRDMNNPYYRALYPYFNPEAEQNWIAVAGLTKLSGEGDTAKYGVIKNFNEAGLGKWWTVAAPGSGIYSSAVIDGSYIEPGSEGYEDKELTDPAYASWGGTSMAAPHVTGAMGVIMSRYQDMSAIQARTVLFTTANHKNPDGTLFDGWDENLAEGMVSDRLGWGAPDLDKAMYGPGQFNGHFDYNMATTKLDVWSNSISQVAWDQRKAEDLKWMEITKNGTDTSAEGVIEVEGSRGQDVTVGGDYVLGDHVEVVGIEDDNISAEDAEKWRAEYYAEKAQSIKDRLENGGYDGSLTKRGAGTLVMTGNNTYRGGTVVEGGTLLGFAESFGVTGEDASATANGKVTVNGGVFGIMNSYNDQFTMKGELTHKADADHSVDITVNKGGTYGIVAGQDVEVGSLSFADGAGITVVSVDGDVLKEAFESETGVTGSVTAEKLEGVTSTNPVVDPDYAFFDTAINVDAENGKIEATLSRNEESASAYAANGSQAAMANALMANTDSAVFADMVGATKGQVRNTLASLSNDFHLAAQNATIVNTALMGRMIKDQANAYGEAQRAELENGATLWAAGMGSWGDVDAGGASVNMDVDYYAGFIGAELPYGNGNKVGVFFGYGQTDFDAGNDGDMDSDDIHIGMYGENDWEKFGLTYGFAYTTQDREGKQSLNFLDQVTHNAIDYNATVFQIFGEASYKGFNTESYQVEPYIGLSWLKVSADDFTQRAGNHSVKTEIDDQNLGLANIGVRGALPFTAGSVAMKVRADVGYMQFFGDKEATAKVTVGDAGTASITGEELSGMGMVGIGLDAAIGKNATFGVNYTGAFGSDITSHGIGAKLGIKF